MNKHYLVFRQYMELEEAANTLKVLEEKRIPGEIKFIEAQLDPLFTGNNLRPKYELKIDPAHFEQAEHILDELAEKELENHEIPADYYLYSFSNEELFDVLIKPHEWNPFDLALAKSILKSRKVELNLQHIEEQKQEQLDKLYEPERPKSTWIYFGYFFSVAGGFLGLIMGTHYAFSKKVMPDGSKVYTYDELTRKDGKLMLIISAIIFPLATLIRVWANLMDY